MQTQTWLCGVVVGCGMMMVVPPRGPVTSEEMAEPEVREAVEDARSLIIDDLLTQQRNLIELIEALSKNAASSEKSEYIKIALKAAEQRLNELRATRYKTRDERLVSEAAFKREVRFVLNAFHKAASEADFDAYFALMHEGGVFLGTDASERWTKPEFMDYARPFMVEQGKGWTYHPSDRHVSVSGDVAWFDELLDNDKYGVLRGSGVLLRVDGDWKIMQYNLAFLVPNEVVDELVRLIRGEGGEP